jgi:hypothetical protein
MKSKLYSFTFFSIAISLLSIGDLNAQGCVAVRNMATCSLGLDSVHQKSWQFTANFRYFKSFRHYKGKEEQVERLENGTEVINHDNSIILGAAYSISKHFSAAISVPLMYIDRSSMYEHLGNNSGQRYVTTSQGLGDIRLTGYWHVLPNYRKGSLIIGLGAKLPTGNYNYKDEFVKPDPDNEGKTELVEQPVDQSIQPGDGGLGIIAELNFVHKVAGRFYGYASGLYMSNPRNTNGTKRSPNLTNGIALSNEFSVVDQFLVRGGVQYVHNGWQVGLGLRYEGIPVYDLIGDSDGFRRPGYIISYEPSVFYTFKKHTVGLNIPIVRLPEGLGSADIGSRNRTQSVIDKKKTEITGTYSHGDAAFADWLISVTYSYKLSR